MSVAEALSAPLLLGSICEESEAVAASKDALGPCVSSTSTSSTNDSLKDTVCEISDHSEASEGSMDCMRADGLVHYPPDADADVCVSCVMMYYALAARTHTAVCVVAFAAGVLCGRMYYMCANCSLCRGVCGSRVVRANGLHVRQFLVSHERAVCVLARMHYIRRNIRLARMNYMRRNIRLARMHHMRRNISMQARQKHSWAPIQTTKTVPMHHITQVRECPTSTACDFKTKDMHTNHNLILPINKC